MHATLPATLPRLPAPTLGGVAYVSIVTLLGLVFLLRLASFTTNWDGADLTVYLRAADSWQHAGNPYLFEGTSGVGTYRYAPWFAALWIPFAGLPRLPLQIAWIMVLLVAMGAVLVSIVREYGWRGLPLALLGGSLLTSSIAGANVQALMVAALYFGLHRRSGPVWVGLAASLKIVPILYVIPWIGRGEWRKAGTAIAVMGLLWAPALLFSMPSVINDPGADEYPSLLIWAPLAGGALLAAVLLARSRYAWVAAGTAALLAVPRLLALDFTVILPAARKPPP